MDNEVYGMTKGQASPTTPMDWDHSKLTPHGPGVRPSSFHFTAVNIFQTFFYLPLSSYIPPHLLFHLLSFLFSVFLLFL